MVYKIQNFKYYTEIWYGKVDHTSFTEEQFKIYFDHFWNNYIKPLNNKGIEYIRLILKSQDVNDAISSYCYLQTFGVNDKEIAYKKMIGYILIKRESYWFNINYYIFTYSSINKDLLSEDDTRQKILDKRKRSVNELDKLKKSIPYPKIGEYTIPLSNRLDLWGTLTTSIDGNYIIINKYHSKLIYKIVYLNEDKTIRKCILLNDGIEVLEFNDFLPNDNEVIRYYNDKVYYSKNNELIVKGKYIKHLKYFKKLSKKYLSSQIKDKFLTLDIETINKKGKLIPTTIAISDGVLTWSYCITDNTKWEDNPNLMIIKALESIVYTSRYRNQCIYVHNFSNFDVVFILKNMMNLTSIIKPLIVNNRIINIKFEVGKNKFEFKDSYQILKSSLKKLAKDFNVEEKGYFPHSFVNSSNFNLNYVGKVPNIKYFDGINLTEYENYCESINNTWSFTNESKKYCEQDVITLHQIMSKFNGYIHTKYHIDIHKCPTAPSLAMAIYKTGDMVKFNIPIFNNEMYNTISKSYKGGHVDIYKHTGENIYRYDINSLYPYAMKRFLMPVGTPYYFEGDILKMIDHVHSQYLIKQDLNAFKENSIKKPIREKRPFGFFEVEVTAPKDLNIPILLTRAVKENNTENSITIAPTGTWTGMYFSEELFNAEAYGYTFKIKKGYLFENELIFSEYINDLNAIKEVSEKDSVDYLTSKFLMNSLYGKFGMNPNKDSHLIINNGFIDRLYLKSDIVDLIDFQNGHSLVSVKKDQEESIANINVSIASAVTAYARILMSDYKLGLSDKGYSIYYTDTDSIDLNKPLPDNLVSSKELGKMKLENIFKKVVYLAPKLYAAISDKGEILKSKGLKESIKYHELFSLLLKGKEKIVYQDKWFKDLKDSTIQIRQTPYTLKVTMNKRQLIYDQDMYINSKPFHLIDGKIDTSI
jgi:hypothetical protein